MSLPILFYRTTLLNIKRQVTFSMPLQIANCMCLYLTKRLSVLNSALAFRFMYCTKITWSHKESVELEYKEFSGFG